MFRRLIASFVCIAFVFSSLQYVHAQDFSINQLPVPGAMIQPSAAFAPLTLKGLVIDPNKPLQFQFIIDTGKGPQDTASIKEDANRLVKYFLAGLTIPEGELWVNLSPYEKSRITTESLGQTLLGRDLLAQDYILKQLTASLIYPEKDLGKEFWSRVYAKAQKQFGTTNILVNTFNKVWILPDEAQVYENGPAAYVTKSTLKVMLDEDYLALKKHTVANNGTDSIGSQIVREVVIPEITKEVNQGQNFAPLRQIYDAMILAKWYKETISNGLLDALYTNKDKVGGVNLTDPAVKEAIYQRYLQAYKKGVFNYIKDDVAPDGQMVPRKYFSGGITKLEPDRVATDGAMTAIQKIGALVLLTVGLGASNPILALTNTPSQTSSAQTQPLPNTKLREEEFQKYINSLNNGNYDLKAIDALGKSGDKRAVEPLLKALSYDFSDKVRLAAQEALTRLGASKEQLVSGYIKALLSEWRFTYEEAAKNLGNLGDKRAIEPLALKLHDTYWVWPAIALGKLGDSRAFEPLVRVLDNQEGHTLYTIEERRYVIQALGQLGDKRAISHIIQFMANDVDLGISSGDFVEVGNKALERLGASNELLFKVNFEAISNLEPQSSNLDILKKAISLYGPQAPKMSDEILQANIKILTADYGKIDKKEGALNILVALGDRRAINGLIESLNHLNIFYLSLDPGRHLDDVQALPDYITDVRKALSSLSADRGDLIRADLKINEITKGVDAIPIEGYHNQMIQIQAEVNQEMDKLGVSGYGRLSTGWTFMLWSAVGVGSLAGALAAWKIIRRKRTGETESPMPTPTSQNNKNPDAAMLIPYSKAWRKAKEARRAEEDRRTAARAAEDAQAVLENRPPSRNGDYPGEIIGEYKWVVIPEHTIRVDEEQPTSLSINGSWTDEAVPEKRYWEKIDKAMLKAGNKNSENLGGIDLNHIAIKRAGHVIKIQFDPAQLKQLQREGFEGFAPVIINMTRIPSPFQLLGINASGR